MPNRILKESICYSENIERLTQFQEIFFYRLIVNCDDFGRMDARPKVLASKLFPLRDIRLNQVTDALRALTSAELVVLYEEDGHPFLQMKTWDRHQTIRAKKSKYPAPDSNRNHLQADEIICKQMQADEINCNQLNADASKCSRNPIQSVSVSESVSVSKSVSVSNPTRTRARETRSDESFNQFWEEYPKKVAKQDAMKAWLKLNPDGEMMESIMSGLEKWKASAEWTRNDGQFIPHPATWLNGRRWEDEIQPAKPEAVTPIRRVVAQDYTQRDYSDEDNAALDRMLEDFL